MRALVILVLGAGCRSEKGGDEGEVETEELPADADGDGYDEVEDCDDSDAQISPGSPEICDHIDNDCDGQLDEGVTSTYYADTDADGFGSEPAELCDALDGYAAVGTDCDDAAAAVYPGAEEICDGLDNDCDGESDEGLAAEWRPDADGDGYGSGEGGIVTCEPPDGYTLDGSDCDDTDAGSFPGGDEVCDEADNDCDGQLDEGVTTTYYLDSDGDGFGIEGATAESCDPLTGYAAAAGDCDDGEAAINPAASEVCGGGDEDCDGDIDEGSAIDAEVWYYDADNDGFGGSSSAVGCLAPTSYVSDSSDCDDADADTHPGAAPADSGTACLKDGDGDGYGDDSPDPGVGVGTDCDDAAAGISPAASEVAGDGVDQDCDDDEQCYSDADNDGYRPDASSALASADLDCADSGEAAAGEPTGDCDDADAGVNPGEAEVAGDEADQDCDGGELCYGDGDGDGYRASTAVSADLDCDDAGEADAGDPSGDCDDADAGAHPGGTEVCDGADNDCSGAADDDALVLGDGALCPAEDCQDLHDVRPGLASGTYWIEPAGSAYPARCEMDLAGGGWTLVGTNDWDGTSWTVASVTDASTFGALSTTASYKGPAWSDVLFSDLLFENGTTYASYEGVSDGTSGYYAFQAAIPFLNCGYGTSYEWAMTEGNLSGSRLCSTNLYIHPFDWDGYSTCGSPTSSNNDGYGPTWSGTYNGACPLDDPAGSGFWFYPAGWGEIWEDGYPWGNDAPLRMYVR